MDASIIPHLTRTLLFDWPLAEEFIEFININAIAKFSQKQFTQIWNFAHQEELSFVNYPMVSGYSKLFDNFVSYVRSKRSQSEETATTEDTAADTPNQA